MVTSINNNFILTIEEKDLLGNIEIIRAHLKSCKVVQIKSFINKRLINNLLDDLLYLAKIIVNGKSNLNINNLTSLLKNNDQYIQLWKTSRDLPSFGRILFNKKLNNVLKKIQNSKQIGIPYDWTLLRIDTSDFPITEFDWHQDYHYNTITKDSLTGWIPLLPSTKDSNIGGMKFSKNTDKKIYPIANKKDFALGDPNRIIISQLEKLRATFESNSCILDIYNAGDLILFNSLTLHKSHYPNNEFLRLTANFRAAGYDSSEFVNKNMYMSRNTYPNYFIEAHPDLVEDN